MLYLLDANVLIDANRDYYPINSVPEYWSWLIHQGKNSFVKIPLEAYEEIKVGNDNLASWIKNHEVEEALLLGEEVNVSLVSLVMNTGYAPDLTDDDVEKIGRDPFLIAYALVQKKERCVVTTEVSKPKRKRANRHVPDVCNSIGVKWCDPFKLLHTLNFRTDWESE